MNQELKSINMEDRNERSYLAENTLNLETLLWFIPDTESMVRLSVVKNPLFNREIYQKLNCSEYVIKKQLLKIDFLSTAEKAKIQKEIDDSKEKNKILDSFCSIPWNHLSIMTNGDVRMCCQMITGTFGKLGVNVKENKNVSEIRNNPKINIVRKQMLQGIKPKLCNLCWIEEENNIKSKRLDQNNIYNNIFDKAIKYTNKDGSIDTSKFPLTYLDLRLGNKCNLSCRSCGPTDSSNWYEESYKLSETKEVNYYNDKVYKLEIKDGKVVIDTDDFDWPKKSNFLEQVLDNVKYIDRLYFTGGEPTLNMPHVAFLEELVKRKIGKNIYIEYNSNGTTISNNIINLWKNFNGIGIGFSIDGTKKRFEYLRYPGKWNKFLRTINTLDKNYKDFNKLEIQLAPTISIFNIIHLLDIYKFVFQETPDWFLKYIPVHVLEGPDYMCAKIIPQIGKEKINKMYIDYIENIDSVLDNNSVKNKKYKEEAIKSLTNINSYLNNSMESSKNLIDIFYQKTDVIDKMRKQSWKKTFPELLDILG